MNKGGFSQNGSRHGALWQKNSVCEEQDLPTVIEDKVELEAAMPAAWLPHVILLTDANKSA